MSSPPEEDIRRTLARYGMLFDDGRFDEFAQLFAEAATFHVKGRSIEGRDAIGQAMAASSSPEVRGKHILSEPLIEVDGWGGTAKAWTDFIFIDQSGAIAQQGRYHDQLEREGDKVWRFTVHEIVFRGDAPEVAAPPPA